MQEGGAFPQELASGMMASNARELSQIPLEGMYVALNLNGD
jgi:hypothetical protein